MPKNAKKPTSPLSALSYLNVTIRPYRVGLVILSTASFFALWSWFYFITQWLNDWMINASGTQFPVLGSIVSLTLLATFQMGRHLLRYYAGKVISSTLYQHFIDELADKRWALIRTKPHTAWQDFLFRHLPAIEQYLLDYQPQKLLVAVLPICVLVLILPFSWLAASTLFITMPLIPLFMWLVGVGAATMHKKHIRVLNHLGQFFTDRILGQSTVRLLNQTKAQLARFQLSSQELNKRLADVVKLAFLSSTVLDFFSTVSMALLAVFIGFSLLGEITIGFWGNPPDLGTGLLILLIAPAFFSELKLLGKLYHVKAEAISSVDSWQSILTPNPKPTPTPCDAFESCRIQDATVVGFENDESKPLLHIPLLDLTAGERIRLQGESGAGKSVLLDALAGLRPLASQQISVNQSRMMSLTMLKNQVLYIGQQPAIFTGTIAENIGLGQFDDATVARAIHRVGLSQWLSHQPNGLMTQLEKHPPLSGGQKQRFALARLVLFDLPIVLLDEPLAHLSFEEQPDLLNLLVTLTDHRTSIWVSHQRLSPTLFTQHWTIDETAAVRSDR